MKDVKKIIQKGYADIAKSSSCCCKNTCVANQIGYDENDIQSFSDANLGLGCGNPTAIGEIKEGDTVLDLGCGAGFDAFLAERHVGVFGKVIGIDMTPEMLLKAQLNAEKLGIKNVEFILGDIEELPIEDESVDIIISNCVVNLAPNKDQVFKEAYRVLRPDGRLYLSDIVLLSDLSTEQKADDRLLTGCVAGALRKEDYLKKIEAAGFHVTITKENREISKQQYNGVDLESVSIRATK